MTRVVGPAPGCSASPLPIAHLSVPVPTPAGDWESLAHAWWRRREGASPVLALHGFTGSGLDFGDLAERLPCSLVAPDLPGHGVGVMPPVPADFALAARQLHAVLDALAAPSAVVLGYSMGGRTALAFAASAPHRVRALVLIGARPGIEDEEARAARAEVDEARALRLEREGLPAFLDWWSGLPLIASQRRIEPVLRAGMQSRRLASRPEGWAASLRGMGTGAMESVWPALPRIRVPVLLICGEEDGTYQRIHEEMAARLPGASAISIPRAGHCPHLEQPAATEAEIRSFLRQLSA